MNMMTLNDSLLKQKSNATKLKALLSTLRFLNCRRLLIKWLQWHEFNTVDCTRQIPNQLDAIPNVSHSNSLASFNTLRMFLGWWMSKVYSANFPKSTISNELRFVTFNDLNTIISKYSISNIFCFVINVLHHLIYRLSSLPNFSILFFLVFFMEPWKLHLTS